MRNNRPKELTYRTVNDTGFIVEKDCRLAELKCYEKSGTVYFYASIIPMGSENNNEDEALQYLTPEVAMKMSKSLKACAIKALENRE